MCRSIALSMQDRIVVTYNFRHQGEAYVYPSSDRLPSSRSERPVSRSVRPCYAFALQLTCGIPRSKSRCKGIKRASLIERQIVTGEVAVFDVHEHILAHSHGRHGALNCLRADHRLQVGPVGAHNELPFSDVDALSVV